MCARQRARAQLAVCAWALHAVREQYLLQDRLEEFARKHKAEIIKNPDFRSKFNSMCTAIGVDPLGAHRIQFRV
jgi:ESCRT-II complex subunit VPS22